MNRTSAPRLPALRRRPATPLRIALLVVAVVAAVAAGPVVFLAAAVATASIPLAVAAGLAAVFAVAGGIALAALRDTRRARPRALLSAAALTTLVAVLAAATVLRPGPHTATPPVATADTRYWDLPDGERIAYTRTPAATPAGRPPVVFLHGGPGVPGEPGGPVLSGPDGLARAGFDVYVYDQLGAGLSSRPADVRSLTADRHVADLELIRRRIGAERLVLVGHSWGSALAARYLAAHPDRVERVVFEAPGPLWEPATPAALRPGLDVMTPAQQALSDRLLTPRVIAVSLLAELDPRAARALAGDAEMDGWDAAAAPLQPSSTCDPALSPAFPPGTGHYVNLATNASLLQVPDLRPALREIRVPALVVATECDYLVPQIAREYREVLPGARLVELPGAGHVAQIEQPALLVDLVRAFLLDEDLPLPAR